MSKYNDYLMTVKTGGSDMYRLRFVYSDGTDDFDYWDEMETFEKDFTDPAELVSKFIKLVQGHPQIESYEIRDSSSIRFPSIYHFIMYHVDDFSYKWELMNSVHNATHWDSEYFDKFFVEANFKYIKTQVVKEEPGEVYKRAVIVDDLGSTELEWIVEVLNHQVDTYVLSEKGNKNIRSFIERLRAALNDLRKEEQDSKEYQEYLRLKEKFGEK